MNDITILAISDTHTLNLADAVHPDTDRRCDLGTELVERAIRDAQLTANFDMIVLLGDLVEDGSAPGADQDLAAMEERIFSLAPEIPLIVVPGNHDPDPDYVLRIFNDQRGLHKINGYPFYSFVDQWDENNVGHRNPDQMRNLRETASSADKPLVVLQHNPLFPPIDDEYPYILDHHRKIMEVYEDVGVNLSLSGHYHSGQNATPRDGVTYWTSPSLSKPPYRYTLIHLHGESAEFEQRRLKLPEDLDLMDSHAHTQYAYCAENVTARGVIERASTFGVNTQCLTEHADQLYLTEEEHASGLAISMPGYWDRPDHPEANRMAQYRAHVAPLATDQIRLGIEVELDRDGHPGIHPDDRSGWDLMLGSVHWLPGNTALLNTETIHKLFLENVHKLLQSGIDVVAHPFRFFHASKLKRPRSIYDDTVDLLKEHGAAAELNFHYNDPDPVFFAQCIDNDIPITTGTDSHRLSEVGALKPHIRFLRRLTDTDRIQDVLLSTAGEEDGNNQ